MNFNHLSFLNVSRTASIVLVVCISSGCALQHGPLFDRVDRQFARTGSTTCDLALDDYVSDRDRNRENMIAKCAPDGSSALTKPSTVIEIGSVKTWSGPNDYCEYEYTVPLDGEDPTSYYFRAIFSSQQNRYFYIGYNSHSEVDLDCIYRAFPSIRNSVTEYNFTDPIYNYAQGMNFVHKGCSWSDLANHFLGLAGQARVPVRYRGADIYKTRNQKNIVPEALYVSALVSLICDQDRDAYFRKMSASISAGYNFAQFSSPVGF